MIPIGTKAEEWALGVDTSAYTTSVALVSTGGTVHQQRRVLPVPMGARGLRPSEALFLHTQFLPGLLEALWGATGRLPLSAVGVSVAPRPDPDSYLPPFLAGEALARGIAAVEGLPVLRTTHQEGHIRAGIAGSGLRPKADFWALHVSGGTTELVHVRMAAEGWQVRMAGGTDDLYAGQFVDRIGVLLGASFPAGPELDQMAEAQDDLVRLPWTKPRQIDGLWRISFSGPESAAERALAGGAAAGPLARGVMESIGKTLAGLVAAAAAGGDLLVVGGVAANTHLRRVLGTRLSNWRVWFADPGWSRDNAIGVAYLALDRFAVERGE